jgi:hypothetical protein
MTLNESPTRNVLCIFNELEGCPVTGAKARALW